MSKPKDLINEVRSKLLGRKQEEMTVQEQTELAQSLPLEAFDVIQDPSTKSRAFLIVKIKYNLETREAVVTDVAPFQDKAAGLALSNDKSNLRYFFDKNTRGAKNENK